MVFFFLFLLRFLASDFPSCPSFSDGAVPGVPRQSAPQGAELALCTGPSGEPGFFFFCRSFPPASNLFFSPRSASFPLAESDVRCFSRVCLPPPDTSPCFFFDGLVRWGFSRPFRPVIFRGKLHSFPRPGTKPSFRTWRRKVFPPYAALFPLLDTIPLDIGSRPFPTTRGPVLGGLPPR